MPVWPRLLAYSVHLLSLPIPILFCRSLHELLLVILPYSLWSLGDSGHRCHTTNDHMCCNTVQYSVFHTNYKVLKLHQVFWWALYRSWPEILLRSCWLRLFVGSPVYRWGTWLGPDWSVLEHTWNRIDSDWLNSVHTIPDWIVNCNCF